MPKLIAVQCVDITFADPSEVAVVDQNNCFNSTDKDKKPIIGFQQIYSSTSSPAPHNAVVNTFASILAPLLLIAASVAWS